VQEFLDAYKKKDYRKLKVIVESDKTILDQEIEFMYKPLQFAIHRRDVRLMKLLILAGVDVNQESSKYLIDEGSDVNCKDYFKENPLHYAVRNGNIDVIQCLIDNGANVHAGTCTPLHHAVHENKLDIGKVLIQNGAELPSDLKYKESNAYQILLDYQRNFKDKMKTTTNIQGEKPSANKYSGLKKEEIQVLKELKLRKMKDCSFTLNSVRDKLTKIDTNKTQIQNERNSSIQKHEKEIQSIDLEISNTEKILNEAKKRLNEAKKKRTHVKKLKDQEMKCFDDKEEEAENESRDLKNEEDLTAVTRFQLLQEVNMLRHTALQGDVPAENELIKHIRDQIRSLEQHLQCPVCKEVSQIPIFTCSNQHHICGQCWAIIKPQGVCPSCRTNMQDPPPRHRLMENMVEQLEQSQTKLNKLTN